MTHHTRKALQDIYLLLLAAGWDQGVEAEDDDPADPFATFVVTVGPPTGEAAQ